MYANLFKFRILQLRLLLFIVHICLDLLPFASCGRICVSVRKYPLITCKIIKILIIHRENLVLASFVYLLSLILAKNYLHAPGLKPEML